LETGVGETPPEKGAACCCRKSIAILSGIWLLQMQPPKNLRLIEKCYAPDWGITMWSVDFCLWKQKCTLAAGLAAIWPSDIIRRAPSFCY
jgi:hypothetical protein